MTTLAISEALPPDVRHQRNIKGSALLLHRLQRLHYDHAPDKTKDRFLPVPFRNALVIEYLRLKDEHKAKSQETAFTMTHRDALPVDVIDITRVMRDIDDAMLYYRRIPVRLMIAVIGRYYGIKPLAILSPARNVDIVHARQVVYYIAREIAAYSFPEIGRRVGGRDHTTALSGYRKIVKQMETDATLRVQIETLRAQVIQQYELLQKAAAA